MKSGPIFWCVACGAFAESAQKLLTQACRGIHEGRWVVWGMRGQLKVLRSGRHPKTFESIPPPIPLRVWAASCLNPPTELEPTVARSLGSKPAPVILDDGPPFTQAFLKRGVRGRPDAHPSVLERFRKKARAAADPTAPEPESPPEDSPTQQHEPPQQQQQQQQQQSQLDP